MNKLQHINNMGITPMPEYEKRALELFIENNPHHVNGMSGKEVYDIYKNTTSFAITRLSVAFGGVGFAVKEAIINGEKEDSFLRKIYNWMRG